MKKILHILFFALVGVQIWACTKAEPTPDYTQAMLGTYEGTLTDSGRSEQDIPYVSSVGKSKLTIEADPAGLNQLIATAYVGVFKTFTVKGKASSTSQLTFEQQAINTAFKAAGKAKLSPNTIAIELKVSDIKYLKYVGKKKL